MAKRRSITLGAISIAAATWLGGENARAGDAGISGAKSFTWKREAGTESCIGEEDLRKKIVELTGRDPFVSPPSAILSGVARKEGDSFVATLSLEQPGEAPTSRELRSDVATCAPLGDAVALAIVLSLEHLRRSSIDSPARAVAENRDPPIATAAPISTTAPAPLEPDGGARARPPGRWSALAQGIWTVGVLPQPTAGLAATLNYRMTERVAASFGGFWLPFASERGQFSMGLAAARLGACIDSIRGETLSLTHCAYGAGGATRVRNDDGGSLTDTSGRAWFAGSLTTGAAARFADRWLVELDAEGWVPFARPVYQTQSCPLVGFQQPVATLGIFLGLGALFP